MKQMQEGTSVLAEIIGDSPIVRTLDFLLVFDDYDYSKTQLAREVAISRITMEKVVDQLVKKGFVVKTRRIGRAELYRLNKKNPYIKELAEFDFRICGIAAREELADRKAVVAKARIS